jgi:hypothetical protein
MFLLVKVSGHLAADASVVRAELYLEPPKNRLHPKPQPAKHPVFPRRLFIA